VILPRETGGATASLTKAVAGKVAGPLATTVTLLDDGGQRVCLITSHFDSPKALNVSRLFRSTLAADLGLPVDRVLLCVSHNHSDLLVAANQVEAYQVYDSPEPPAKLDPVGVELLEKLRAAAAGLAERLQPVTVCWSQGTEGRITYNRKGRRADGSTYMMREEDRDLVGADFTGDIDREAPVVLFKDREGRVVSGLAQFTGHPVTCYNPERPVVFGEWPQVACDLLARHLDAAAPPPLGFLQGCAGDVNSKGMFRWDVTLSEKLGRMLADSYVAALAEIRTSVRDGMDYEVARVQIPLAPLPTAAVLRDEVAEMENFIRRADAGDPDTLSCVGLNFPRELTPAFRARLVEGVLAWNRWALERHATGTAEDVARHLEVEIQVLRLGDVGVVCMPFEPFQGIGRQIRGGSPLPLAIPCGYANTSHGYLTDGANTGDREYMSAFYRYTRHRPPYRKPAGDVIASRALDILDRFAKENDGR
jgi:hypothetical protein